MAARNVWRPGLSGGTGALPVNVAGAGSRRRPPGGNDSDDDLVDEDRDERDHRLEPVDVAVAAVIGLPRSLSAHGRTGSPYVRTPAAGLPRR